MAKPVATHEQTIELVGGAFDGETYYYQYSNNPIFWIFIGEYQYRMCSDGKFRLERHADDFEKRAKRAKKK